MSCVGIMPRGDSTAVVVTVNDTMAEVSLFEGTASDPPDIVLRTTNADDGRNFSHASLRRLRAEVMLDAISQVTETKNKFAGLPLGARAVQIANGNTSTYFLTAFGRATRESVCSCEVKMEPNLSQALHLLNGATLHGKIQEGKKILEELEEEQSPLFNLTKAAMYIQLGEYDRAFEILKSRPRHAWYPWIRIFNLFEPIWEDPRFKNIMHELNLPDPAPFEYHPELHANG